MERIVTTNPFNGFCAMQVCAEADVTDEEILKHCNKTNPSGTTNGWVEVRREGEGAPVACSDHPGRMHFLAIC